MTACIAQPVSITVRRRPLNLAKRQLESQDIFALHIKSSLTKKMLLIKIEFIKNSTNVKSTLPEHFIWAEFFYCRCIWNQGSESDRVNWGQCETFCNRNWQLSQLWFMKPNSLYWMNHLLDSIQMRHHMYSGGASFFPENGYRKRASIKGKAL